jgi:dimethylhistidine N-methyltransferase
LPAATQLQLSAFARDVAAGFSDPTQKYISARYFYDDLGSALFEAITLLPEYGLTRADQRLLSFHAAEIANAVEGTSLIAELGSGSGKKTRNVIAAVSRRTDSLRYSPIDVSAGALAQCEKELCDVVEVSPICADWLDGLAEIGRKRANEGPLLLLFLDSSIGNLERSCIPDFLKRVRSQLEPGDYFLLGADLVKDIGTMIAAYDDPTGVTAAFNLNLLARINRELDANFDLRSFAHEVRWNSAERRIEMHLASERNQSAYIQALGSSYKFQAGETIWTESSHKFTVGELDCYARAAGFTPANIWIDNEWPFAEALWEA